MRNIQRTQRESKMNFLEWIIIRGKLPGYAERIFKIIRKEDI